MKINLDDGKIVLSDYFDILRYDNEISNVFFIMGGGYCCPNGVGGSTAVLMGNWGTTVLGGGTAAGHKSLRRKGNVYIHKKNQF